MAQLNIPIHGFGGLGGNIPIHGFGEGGEAGAPIIVPDTGLIAGGDSFIIAEAFMSNSSQSDAFTGGSLDLGRWTNISSGGGSVSTGSGLLMTTPGTAAIETVTSYINFDVAATYTFDRTVETISPSSTVTYLDISAHVAGNNSFHLAHLWDPLLGPIVKCYRVDNGVPSTLRVVPMKGSVGTLRLQRFEGRIRAYIGAQLFFDLQGWFLTTMNIRLTSSMNAAVPISPLTRVTAYTPNLLVTFGKEICDFAQESAGGRVIGYTPATRLPVGVEVKVHSVLTTKTLGPNSFIYTSPLQLTISRNNSTIVISNDDTLRDSTEELKGFRL